MRKPKSYDTSGPDIDRLDWTVPTGGEGLLWAEGRLRLALLVQIRNELRRLVKNTTPKRKRRKA